MIQVNPSRRSVTISVVILLIVVAAASLTVVAQQPGDVTSSTIRYVGGNGIAQTASLEQTDVHLTGTPFPHADDPNWINTADGGSLAHIEWITFKALDNANWSAKVRCRISNLNVEPVVCKYEIRPPNNQTYEDNGIGYIGPDGHRYQAFIINPNQLPASPQFKIRTLP
jgi:hypothetical protein